MLSAFLAAEQQRLTARTFASYRSVVDLLRHCLNGYGHQYLDDDERRDYEAAFDAGDEDAFVHLFGPEKIPEALGEFLDYFMVRKVMAGEELMRAAGTVTKKLAKWMAANGYLDAAAAGEAAERGARAARDLPRAERLARLLFEQAQRVAKDDADVAQEDLVEDYFTIERVEPGALWLSGNVGPVKVSKEASSLAQAEWSMYLLVAVATQTAATKTGSSSSGHGPSEKLGVGKHTAGSGGGGHHLNPPSRWPGGAAVLPLELLEPGPLVTRRLRGSRGGSGGLVADLDKHRDPAIALDSASILDVFSGGPTTAFIEAARRVRNAIRGERP